MKKQGMITLSGIAAFAAFVLLACRMSGSITWPVTDLSLTGKVIAPVHGALPNAAPIDARQYTGIIVWQTADDLPHAGPFEPATSYKAAVLLTAKNGFTFIGLEANSFTYRNAIVTNSDNSGMATISFPATANDAMTTKVSDLSLDDKITTPSQGALPDSTPIDTDQYTGIIIWQTADDLPHAGPFASSTSYKALVVLTAKPGFTFFGVKANSFKYTGAAVTNPADSGIVAIIFPNTGSFIVGDPSVKIYIEGSNAPLAHNGTTSIAGSEGIFTVRIDDSYSKIIWYVNGNPQTQAQGKTSIILSKQRTGTYLVTVKADQDNAKQSGSHTFKVGGAE
jgi:hypothetical protein